MSPPLRLPGIFSVPVNFICQAAFEKRYRKTLNPLITKSGGYSFPFGLFSSVFEFCIKPDFTGLGKDPEICLKPHLLVK
jgi:hypothetical protein